MAWTELDASGNYAICFRVGGRRFKRSLKTSDEKAASRLVGRVEENLRLVELGRMEMPSDVDIIQFLLSDGRVTGPVVVPEQVTLHQLFVAYFAAIPNGNLEATTIYGMKIHQRQLEAVFGASFAIRGVSTVDLQTYIDKRSKDKGRNGTVAASTIRKAIVTLRTVWNWGLQRKLVHGSFPSKGLKYPKGKEKPPFTPFGDIERITGKMAEAEAREWWECAFLGEADITALLSHVKTSGRHPFIYPLFVFAAHTGARRSEIRRARVTDVDLRQGVVTLRERKKSHDTKTTRRVPMSATLKRALKVWLAHHPGGIALFCHGQNVHRSKKRSERTGFKSRNRPKTELQRMATVTARGVMSVGPLTRNEISHHFKKVLAGSRWAKLHGLHTLRHSFISCLAAKGVDQRIIDEFSGHQTDEQRRCYRHLFPSNTRHAIAQVFG